MTFSFLVSAYLCPCSSTQWMEFSYRLTLIASDALLELIICISAVDVFTSQMVIYVGSFFTLVILSHRISFTIGYCRTLENHLALCSILFSQSLSCSCNFVFPSLLRQNLVKSIDSLCFLAYC